jgi:PTH1 family peptidyl-tRNA hydrolase
MVGLKIRIKNKPISRNILKSMTSSGVKLIVGLGNPGLAYIGSRHNIGFAVLKLLASSLKINFKRDATVSSLVARYRNDYTDLILAMPQTYMNLSGIAVAGLVKKFKVSRPNILVVCDDLDLEIGRIRIRPQGTSAGHRGMASIIEHLGDTDFCRLRIGIGRPANNQDPAEYVLGAFGRQKAAVVKQVTQDATCCCMSWIAGGIEKTMNSFNLNPASAKAKEKNKIN